MKLRQAVIDAYGDLRIEPRWIDLDPATQDLLELFAEALGVTGASTETECTECTGERHALCEDCARERWLGGLRSALAVNGIGDDVIEDVLARCEN